MSEPVPSLPSYAELVALVGELRSELSAARAEIAELRAENAVLRAENAGLREENERLRRENAELRRRLGLNSRNSSKPPSSDGLAKPAPKSLRGRSGRGPGKPAGGAGGTLRQVEDPDERVVHVPERCAGCGDRLEQAPVVSSAVRQVFDIPPVTAYVVEHVLESRACACGHVTAASAPAGVNAPAQYGPGVKAAGVYLRVRHHLPWQRCALLLADLLGTTVTAAALREWTARAATLVAGFTAVVRKRITDAPVAGFDETGARVEGRTRWIHTAVTDTFTAYLLHDKRGTVAFDAMGVLPAFTGTAVHDGWKPYKTYTGPVHALCNAHHLRELAGVAEADKYGQAWAADLAALLKTIWDDRKQRQAEGATAFTVDELDAYRDRYLQAIDAGHTANPPGTGRRRSRAQNLLHRLDTERDQVLRFATDWRVPFDNNTAEQAIRMAKIQVNVSHGWRTIQGARRFLALRSYLETAKKHGLDLHDTLARLFDGRGTWIPAPS